MFKELYYWAYTIFSKKKRFKGVAADKAVSLVSALQSLNILSILFIIDHYYPFIKQYLFFNPDEGRYSPKNWIFALVVFIPFTVYNHYHLHLKRKDIIQHFEEKQMTQFRKDWGVLFFWLYVIATGIILFSIALALRKTS